MKLTSGILAVLLGTFAGVNSKSIREELEGGRVIKIHSGEFSSNADLVDLLHSHNVDHFGTHADTGFAHMKLSTDAVRALEEQNVKFEDATDSWVKEMDEILSDPNLFCSDDAHACAGRSLQDFYAQYQELDALHARMDALAAANPTKATIGTLGLSYQGRNLKTINIGDQTKPLVFYFCNIHAREWLTPMYCMYMADMLLADGGHELLDSFSFTILTSANPDGYVYSRTTSRSWRKTRKPNPGSSCVGTDGNRNYPISHCGSGASTNPCDETYCGVTPLDQPETAAIAAFAAANAGRLIATNDVHAYGQLWMCPYAYTYSLPNSADFNKMQTCNAAAAEGIRAVHGRVFDYGSVANTIYIAAGGSTDYFYVDLGVIYAYTVEVRGNTFFPPASDIMPSNEEIFGGMVASLECVANAELTSPPSPTAPTVTNAPVVTPAPTKFPTQGCADRVPSGLVWSDGTPAECEDFSTIYCLFYQIVVDACPETCGECDFNNAVDIAALRKKENIVPVYGKQKLVKNLPALGSSNNVETGAGSDDGMKNMGQGVAMYVIAPIGAAIVVAAGVAAVVLKMKKRSGEEADATATEVTTRA